MHKVKTAADDIVPTFRKDNTSVDDFDKGVVGEDHDVTDDYEDVLEQNNVGIHDSTGTIGVMFVVIDDDDDVDDDDVDNDDDDNECFELDIVVVDTYADSFVRMFKVLTILTVYV